MKTARAIIVALVAGVATLILQAAAICVLFGLYGARPSVPLFFLIQAFTSLVGATFVLCLIPAQLRHPLWKGLLYNACFLFFLPVGGLVLLCGTLALRYGLPSAAQAFDAELITPPDFEPRLMHRVRPGAGARAQAAVLHPGVKAGERMAAMASIRNVSPHITATLLRRLLGDTQDEMRLVAYGILDQAEKNIMRDIADTLKRLEKRRGSRHEPVDHAHLAELYWEMVYQGLTKGDMRQYMLAQSAIHARLALEQRPNIAGMYYLLGRHALEHHDPAEAARQFSLAQDHGMSERRISTWQAEALFQQGRMKEVGQWVARIPEAGAGAQLQAVMRYWQ